MSETNQEVVQNVSHHLSREEELEGSSLLDSDGKNSMSLWCLNCNCLLLRPNIALFVKIEKELPAIMVTPEDTNRLEVLYDFWLVSDMFQFENMAFSKNVEDIKYLACAECDIGPIGWHNLNDQKCYIAINRIRHQ